MPTRVRFLIALTCASFVVGTLGFWATEHPHNPNAPTLGDAAWWWVVSTTTVGYGDVVPHTNAGRIFAALSMVVGFYLFATGIAVVSESVHAHLERDTRGTARVRSRGHIVLCDYTAIADEMIRALRANEPWKTLHITVVTDLVQVAPYPDCTFVRGVPFSPDVLRKANVPEASYVFVFANFRFADPDLKTLHVAARVLEVNPRATIFVEMVDPEHELLRIAAGNLVPMDSQALLRAVLSGSGIDPKPLLQGLERPFAAAAGSA